MTKRIDVTILGRTLGTASGWDGDPGEATWFYDFEPKEGVDLPAGCLMFEETKGMIGEMNDATGLIIEGKDVVYFLHDIPRD